tara:strand:+ start:68 stop:565 length:498 start_codon:yes stop_codon:yes gene_type:complete
MSWTPEKEKKLRDLWKKGHSASQIASMLEGTTRNAVIGKAHRLNLESRNTSKRSEVKNNKQLNISPVNKNQKLGRKAKFKALLLSKDMEKENPIQLEDCSDKLCRWPNNHPGDKDFYFCGRTALEGAVYCSLHFLIAFQSKNEKEEEKITEEDIPSFLEKKIKSA